MRSFVEVFIAVKILSRIRRNSVLCLILLIASGLSSPASQTKLPKVSEVRAHLQRGESALKAKNTDTAEAEFRAVLALDSRNAAAHLNLGVIAFSQGDYRIASQHLRKALAVRPSIPQALALLGICEKRLGNSSAQAQLERSFSRP